MIDKILKMFFIEKKQAKRTASLTFTRKSSPLEKNNDVEIKSREYTSLSKYFSNIKGLNYRERVYARLK